MNTSFLDRIIRELNPGAAVKRLQDKARFDSIQGSVLNRAYAGVNDTRLRTHRAFNRSRVGSEEFQVSEFDRNHLRLECRDLYRNNEIVRGAVNRFVDYSVWTGIFPQAQTTSREWNKTAEDWWNQIYTPTADFRQIQGVDLIELERLTISSRILDGEVGFILLENGQIQPVEAERICTPQKFSQDKLVTQGIRRTPKGIVTGYFICDRSNGGSVDNKKFRFIPKENFIHCFKPGRIDQIRGIPELAPAINKLRDYDETEIAVLNKVKLDSYQQFKRTTETGLPNERARDAYTRENSNSKDPQRIEKHEQLRIHNLRPGEDLQGFESKTPNSQYIPFMQHQLQSVAAALGISYEYLMLIFTQGSFSSQRAAMIHSHHTFTTWNNWQVKCMLARLWNWRVAKAIKARDLPAAPVISGKSEWFKVEWSLPKMHHVDPDKEVKADQNRYNLGATSLKSITRSMGRDRDDVLAEKSGDIAAAITLADQINAEHAGANVSWKDLITTGGKGETTPQPIPAGSEDE